MSTLAQTIATFRGEAESAFGGLPLPAEDSLCSCSLERISTDPEMRKLVSDFRGKHWRQVPLEVITRHYSALWLFSETAFRFYLPAYLLASLDTFRAEDTSIYHYTMYSLTPLDSEGVIIHHRVAVFDRFSWKQKSAIRKFLLLCRDEIPEEYQTDATVEALDNYWLKL